MTTRVDSRNECLIGVPSALGTPVLAQRVRKLGDHGSSTATNLRNQRTSPLQLL
jgi:hypothetical protein